MEKIKKYGAMSSVVHPRPEKDCVRDRSVPEESNGALPAEELVAGYSLSQSSQEGLVERRKASRACEELLTWSS